MLAEQCDVRTAHGPHEWYWKNILRRECPGLVAASEDEVWEAANAVVTAHNAVYHPGRDCPAEDGNGACAFRKMRVG